MPVLYVWLYLEQLKQLAAGKNFLDFVYKMVLQMQFGNGSSQK